MPPQDPRTPGLVGSNFVIQSATPDNETLRQLNESVEERANRLHDDLVAGRPQPPSPFLTPGQLKEEKKQKAKVCRNTQKIGDTTFKCLMKHEESDVDEVFGPQHEERGRIVRDNVTTRYVMQWWDAETEVIR